MRRIALPITGTVLLAGAGAVAAQDLENAQSSEAVASAHWTELADTYLLQLVLNVNGPALPAPVPARTSGFIKIADSRPGPAPWLIDQCAAPPDRGTAFICTTIANLRGLGYSELACGLAPVPVQAWLLTADGRQVVPATHRCLVVPTQPVEISYEFPVSDSARAMAVAIRIGDEFYIDTVTGHTPAAP